MDESKFDVPATRAITAEEVHGLPLDFDHGIETTRSADGAMHERPRDRMVAPHIGTVFRELHARPFRETAMTSTTGMQFQFAVRLDSVRLRRVYPKVRESLLACGYQLTDTVPVLHVLERLVAVSAERDAKRVQLLVHVSENETHIEVVDRRRLRPLAVVPTDVVSRELARTSGASRVGDRGGLVLWAIVDRQPQPGIPHAA